MLSFNQLINNLSETNKSLVKGITSIYSKSELMAKLCFPIDYNMLDNLGFTYPREVYHLTNFNYLSRLMKYQNRFDIQISTFTKGDNNLLELPSKPNILLKLKGIQLLESKSDMYTLVDEDGQRWINLQDNKFKFYLSGILSSIYPILPKKYKRRKKR